MNVMPNHRALARRFAMSDNFYVDSDVSADGHRWLVGAYANHWVETITAAGYGGGARFERDSGPGPPGPLRVELLAHPRGLPGAGLALAAPGAPPRAVPQLRRRVRVRRHRREGKAWSPRALACPSTSPCPSRCSSNTSRLYPGYNMNIPDQYRADVFLKDLARWSSGEEPMPRFVFLLLPNDHGAQPRPERGYPWLESYMADNDLALGRIVEALSRSPFWTEMAVFVTEDDAQSGRDHVDAHRSLCPRDLSLRPDAATSRTGI